MVITLKKQKKHKKHEKMKLFAENLIQREMCGSITMNVKQLNSYNCDWKAGECADMETEKIRVRMFGRCSISYGDVCIEDSSKRASKIWLLVIYLICNRGKNISQEELIKQLWGNDDSNLNPNGVLKTTLWRARSLLDELWPSAGHELILNRNNGYEWNTEIPMDVDVTMFEEFCRKASDEDNDKEKLSALRSAVALYQNDFLEKYSAEEWIEPLTAYYNNLYIYTVLELLARLNTEVYADEIIRLARAAMETAPYQEELYRYMMLALMKQGDYKQAEEVYEELRELLYANLGITPGDSIQELHVEIFRNLSGRSLTAEMLREQLQEKEPMPGPLFCEFAVFKQFYQAEARSISRRGDAVHVAMLTVIAADGKELSESNLEKAMGQLREQIRGGLRRGDVVSRCSTTQFALLLLQADYENSSKVCDRIVRGYMQAYSQPAIQIQKVVLPLEPLQSQGNQNRTQKYSWNQ